MIIVTYLKVFSYACPFDDVAFDTVGQLWLEPLVGKKHRQMDSLPAAVAAGPQTPPPPANLMSGNCSWPSNSCCSIVCPCCLKALSDGENRLVAELVYCILAEPICEPEPFLHCCVV